MTNPTLELLAARKSVRVFTAEPVSAEEKAAIFEATFGAPSGGNQQQYTILDITDQTLKERLADLCDHQPFIATAPLVLVFLADCQRWPEIYKAAGNHPRPAGVGDLLLACSDANIAAQNAVIAAESLGLGSCYIGDVLENCEEMRETLKLPPWTMPAAMLVIGHPTRQQRERKKPARFAPEQIVMENTYRMPTPEHLREGMEERAAREGTPNYAFEPMTTAFMDRKYESGFSREMTRSVGIYLQAFETEFEL